MRWASDDEADQVMMRWDQVMRWASDDEADQVMMKWVSGDEVGSGNDEVGIR